MPKEDLLYKYNLTQFVDVVRAVRYKDNSYETTCFFVYKSSEVLL